MKLLTSLFLFTQVVQAQQSSYSEVLDRFHSEKQFNGMVLVATNGTIDFLGSVGMADRALGLPLSPTSRFRISSMSKVFTAVLVMKLVDEGKVRLDVPIREYLPEFRGAGRDSVTIHHLLTYSSGIEPTLDALGMAPYQSPKTLDAFIEAYSSGPLVHTPGSRSVYGNTEYILLHHLIETVTKRRYEAVLEEVIVRPAGLTDTQLITADAANAGWVPSYVYNDSLAVFTADTPYLPHLYFGAGALYSTAEDLLAFDQALFTHRLLSRASTEQLLTLHPDLGYTAYGLLRAASRDRRRIGSAPWRPGKPSSC